MEHKGGEQMYLPNGTFEYKPFHYETKEDIIKRAKSEMKIIHKTKRYDVIHYFGDAIPAMPVVEATADGGVYDCESGKWIIGEDD